MMTSTFCYLLMLFPAFVAYGIPTRLVKNIFWSLSNICFTIVLFISFPAQLFGAKSLQILFIVSENFSLPILRLLSPRIVFSYYPAFCKIILHEDNRKMTERLLFGNIGGNVRKLMSPDRVTFQIFNQHPGNR